MSLSCLESLQSHDLFSLISVAHALLHTVPGAAIDDTYAYRSYNRPTNAPFIFPATVSDCSRLLDVLAPPPPHSIS